MKKKEFLNAVEYEVRTLKKNRDNKRIGKT